MTTHTNTSPESCSDKTELNEQMDPLAVFRLGYQETQRSHEPTDVEAKLQREGARRALQRLRHLKEEAEDQESNAVMARSKGILRGMQKAYSYAISQVVLQYHDLD